jgi:hypothetical protein
VYYITYIFIHIGYANGALPMPQEQLACWWKFFRKICVFSIAEKYAKIWILDLVS